MAIKIVSIISRMNVGGPAVLLGDLIEGLNPLEFEHTLLTGVCRANEIDYLESHPWTGKVIYLPEVQRSILPFKDIKGLIAMIAILRRIKPDVVHTHTSKAGVLGRIATRLAAPKARVVHTYHGHVLYGYFPKFTTNLIVILERSLAKITDVLVAITSQVEADLRSVRIGNSHQWRMIRLGIKIEPLRNRAEARHGLNIRGEEMTFLWIGRFAAIKNPIFALKAFKEFCGNNSGNYRLIMVGDGELKEDAEQFASDAKLQVDFVGWSNDVYKYLPAVDILLLTSVNEGMGMVILEAATQNVPTLATNVGGVTEFIKDGETGFLSSLNVHEYAIKMKEIVSAPDLIDRTGKGARALVESEFSRELFVKNHANLYRELYRPIKSA